MLCPRQFDGCTYAYFQVFLCTPESKKILTAEIIRRETEKRLYVYVKRIHIHLRLMKNTVAARKSLSCIAGTALLWCGKACFVVRKRLYRTAKRAL